MKLQQVVKIAPQFQRSVRIDLDFGREDAFAGYVFQQSGQEAISVLLKHIRESTAGAFTFTGPFGGGKSSLALLLASRLAGRSSLKIAATKKLGAKIEADIAATAASKKPWRFIPLVGARRDLVATLWEVLEKEKLVGRPSRRDGAALAETLLELSADVRHGGILLIVDELGKHLEFAAREDGDIFSLQQLAEAANRSKGRLIFIGVLHQSFDQYASRLGRESKDEWAKIQGRFVDIPVITPVDEVIELVGRAVIAEDCTSVAQESAKVVAEEIRRNRPGYSEDLARRLERCWPLHPATTALLGPISRRRFSQNERSVFSFLGSAEPLGFRDFLAVTSLGTNDTFSPAKYWDYLRANLEPSILASPDGHRWAQAAEALSRAEAKGSAKHIEVTKTVSLIDLFKNGSGLSATTEVVWQAVGGKRKDVEIALSDLSQWSVLAHRKHINAWVIHEGSDFDVDRAVGAALSAGVEFRLDRLAMLSNLQPILAKRLYHQTGTLRWFLAEVVLLDGVEDAVRKFSGDDGAAGKFLLAIPTPRDGVRGAKTRAQDASKLSSKYPVAVGVAENAAQVRDLGFELLALEHILRRQPEIEGDAVARREVNARISTVSSLLEEELRRAFVSCEWFVQGNRCAAGHEYGLSQLASDLAAKCFPHSPRVSSELVNRERPSSNSQAAVRQLLWAMVAKSHVTNLGLEGFSAERGLHSTVLEATGLHRVDKDGSARFIRPGSGVGDSFVETWKAADELLIGKGQPVPFAEIYRIWQEPPYGIRKGLLPILAIAYALSNPKTIFLYREGVYQPEITPIVTDTLLQDPSLISVRWFETAKQERRILQEVGAAVRKTISPGVELEPLALAKVLVRFAFELPKWTHRTSHLTKAASGALRLLLSANDPNKLVFIDLPSAVSVNGEQKAIGPSLEACIVELSGAYGAMLESIRLKLFERLRSDGDTEDLRSRAQVVHGISGDLLLDAFALRLANAETERGELEGLISLVTNKPPREWADRDVDVARIELARLAMRFRQVELLASVQGRTASRHAVAVAVSLPDGQKPKLRSIDLSSHDRSNVRRMAEDIRKFLLMQSSDKELCLAAMAEAAFKLADGELPDGV